LIDGPCFEAGKIIDLGPYFLTSIELPISGFGGTNYLMERVPRLQFLKTYGHNQLPMEIGFICNKC